MKRRILAAAVALLLLIGMMPVTALAAQTYTITFDPGNGAVYLGTTSYTPGETVEVTVDKNADHQIKHACRMTYWIRHVVYGGQMLSDAAYQKTFIGWKYDDTIYKQGDTINKVKSNMTLTAVFDEENFPERWTAPFPTSSFQGRPFYGWFDEGKDENGYSHGKKVRNFKEFYDLHRDTVVPDGVGEGINKIYAIWDHAPHVTINANGGKCYNYWNEAFDELNWRQDVDGNCELPEADRVRFWYYLNYDPNGGELSFSNPQRWTTVYVDHFSEFSDDSGNTYQCETSYYFGGDTTIYAQYPGKSLDTDSDTYKATRDGFEFTGWYDAPSGGSKVTSVSFTPDNGEVTVYAHWSELPKYTVAFDTAGGSAVASQTVVKDKTASRPESDPTRSGYKFDDWYDAASGGSKFDFSTPITADTTVYARWIKLYTVRFDTAGGSDIDDQTVADGDKAEKPDDPSMTGSKFKGWYDAAEGGDEFDFGTPITADVTVYAQWYDIFDISFDANGGSGAPASIKKTETEDVTLDGSEPDGREFTVTLDGNGGKVSGKTVKAVQEFDRWDSEKDGGGEISAAADGTLSDSADTYCKANGNKAALYAQWKDAKAEKPADPTRNGYDFAGWFDAPEKGNEVTFPLTVTEDVTVYAQWTPHDGPDDNARDSDVPSGSDIPVSPSDKPDGPSGSDVPVSPSDKPDTPDKPVTPSDVPDKPVSDRIRRLGGDDRFGTANKISAEGWDKADTVVIAAGANYPDALAGAVLAKKLGGPILLAKANSLDDATMKEIERLGAKDAVILGGSAAVGDGVDSALKARGVNVTRVSGANRNDTAALIAYSVAGAKDAQMAAGGGKADTVILVSNANYADALSVSPAAALRAEPILYLNKDGSVPAETKAAIEKLGAKNAYIIGGPAAIGTKAETELEKLGVKSARVYGADRCETAIKVYDTFKADFKSKGACIATGKNFPDALAGGAFAANRDMPVFLVGDSVTPELRARTKDADRLYIFGGTAAVSAEIEKAL